MPGCLTRKDLVFVNLWKPLMTSTVERQVTNIGRLQFNTYRYPLVCACWGQETAGSCPQGPLAHHRAGASTGEEEHSIKHGAVAT